MKVQQSCNNQSSPISKPAFKGYLNSFNANGAVHQGKKIISEMDIAYIGEVVENVGTSKTKIDVKIGPVANIFDNTYGAGLAYDMMVAISTGKKTILANLSQINRGAAEIASKPKQVLKEFFLEISGKTNNEIEEIIQKRGPVH